jgi:hypothetical protein
MLWFGLFLWYTIDEDRYGGGDCLELREWAFAFALYSLICVLIRGYRNDS